MSGTSSLRLIPCLLLALAAAGCRSTDSPSAPATVDEEIIRTRDQVRVSPAELVEALADAEVIYLGEKHDAVRHHELQLEVVEALLALGRRPTLGFEVFALGQTGPLMDYSRDEADTPDTAAQGAEADSKALERLRERLEWGPTRDETWSWYAPLLRIARREQLPVFGADLSQALRQRIGQQGIEGLTSLERSLLFPTGFEDPEYEALMHEQIKQAHCGWGPPDYLARMYETWIARNDAMSLAISASLDDRPDEPVVMMLGAAHTLYDRGVYERVEHRRPGVRQVNLAFREWSAAAGEPPALRLMAVDESRTPPDHQYLWFTRPSGGSDEDLCAAFRQRETGESGDAPRDSREGDER